MAAESEAVTSVAHGPFRWKSVGLYFLILGSLAVLLTWVSEYHLPELARDRRDLLLTWFLGIPAGAVWLLIAEVLRMNHLARKKLSGATHPLQRPLLLMLVASLIPLTLLVKHAHRERELQLAYEAIDMEAAGALPAAPKVAMPTPPTVNSSPVAKSEPGRVTAAQMREYEEVSRLVMADLQKAIENAEKPGGRPKTSLSAAELKRVQDVVVTAYHGDPNMRTLYILAQHFGHLPFIERDTMTASIAVQRLPRKAAAEAAEILALLEFSNGNPESGRFFYRMAGEQSNVRAIGFYIGFSLYGDGDRLEPNASVGEMNDYLDGILEWHDYGDSELTEIQNAIEAVRLAAEKKKAAKQEPANRRARQLRGSIDRLFVEISDPPRAEHPGSSDRVLNAYSKAVIDWANAQDRLIEQDSKTLNTLRSEANKLFDSRTASMVELGFLDDAIGNAYGRRDSIRGHIEAVIKTRDRIFNEAEEKRASAELWRDMREAIRR